MFFLSCCLDVSVFLDQNPPTLLGGVAEVCAHVQGELGRGISLSLVNSSESSDWLMQVSSTLVHRRHCYCWAGIYPRSDHGLCQCDHWWRSYSNTGDLWPPSQRIIWPDNYHHQSSFWL